MPITPVAAAVQRERLVAALRPVAAPVLADAPATSCLDAVRVLPEVLPASSWLHGFSRLDVSGRVRDAVVFAELGWGAGTPVKVQRDGARLVVRSSETPNCHLDARGRLVLADAFRQALHLAATDGVLLSGDTARGVLVVTPARLCDRVVER